MINVVETMRPLPFERFAQAPRGVRGMAIIRGAPTPVLALALLFDGSFDSNFDGGLDSEPIDNTAFDFTGNESKRFITVKVGDRKIALAVDAVIGVESIASASLQQLPPLLGVAHAQTVEAIGASDVQLLLLLNAARLIDDTTAAIAEQSA